jgi:hypothetical protein
VKEAIIIGALILTLAVGYYAYEQIQASEAAAVAVASAPPPPNPGGKSALKDANGNNVYGTYAVPVNPDTFVLGQVLTFGALTPTFGIGSYLTAPSDEVGPGSVCAAVSPPNPQYPTEVVVATVAQAMTLGANNLSPTSNNAPAGTTFQSGAQINAAATSQAASGLNQFAPAGTPSTTPGAPAYGTTYLAMGAIPGNPQNTGTVVTWCGPGAPAPLSMKTDGWYYSQTGSFVGSSQFVMVSSDPNFPATNAQSYAAANAPKSTSNVHNTNASVTATAKALGMGVFHV